MRFRTVTVYRLVSIGRWLAQSIVRVRALLYRFVVARRWHGSGLDGSSGDENDCHVSMASPAIEQFGANLRSYCGLCVIAQQGIQPKWNLDAALVRLILRFSGKLAFIMEGLPCV